jgi:nitronate monooxygenase
VGRIGTLALVPQVVDAVSIPVIAGGGIMDGRGLVATLALGAVGVNMGTRFLLSPEVRYISSPFSFARGEVPKEDFRENIKKRYVEANEDQTTLTEGIAGGIERMTLGNWPPLWKRPNAPKPLALPYQMYSIEPLTRAAYETGRYDLISTGIGQGVGMLKEEMKAGDIVRKVIEEAREVLARLQA